MLIFFCVFTVGCSTAPRVARVNDVSVPRALDSGYRVVAVDDTPASRAASPIATVVPVVEVSPGPHKFSVAATAAAPAQSFTAVVEADKEYRIASGADGQPKLVEYGK